MLKKSIKSIEKIKYRPKDDADYMVAEKTRVSGADILVCNIRYRKVAYEVFVTKDDFICRYDNKLSVKDPKWLMSCYGDMPTCKRGKKTVMDFVSENGIEVNRKDHPLTMLTRLCRAISAQKSDERAKKRKQKEFDQTSVDMALFRPVNEKAMDSFAKRKVFKDFNFLIFNAGEGFCTKCEKPFDAKSMRPKHNTEYTCPSCKAKLLAQNAKIKKKSYEQVAWSVKIERAKGNLLFRYFRHIKTIQNLVTEIKTKELLRTAFHPDGTWHEYSFDYDRITDSCEWGYYKSKHGIYGDPSEYVRPRSCFVYNLPSKLQALTEKHESLKYAPIGAFIKQCFPDGFMQGRPFMVESAAKELTKPALEKLVKVGLGKITLSIMDRLTWYSWRGDDILLDEKTPAKILRLTKEQYKTLLKTKDPEYKDLSLLRNFSEDEFFELRCLGDNSRWIDVWKEIKRFTSIHKAIRYLYRQEKDATFYRDYLQMIEECGSNMKSNGILFPKNLEEAHDRALAERNRLRDEIAKAKQDAFNKELEKNKKQFEAEIARGVRNPINLKLGSLEIRLPFSVEEIRDEGEKLHHCVSRYIKDVIDKKTQIFFIRKAEFPDIPYFTLEWKDGVVQQVHGLKNSDPTPEVAAFVQTWSKEMLKQAS